MHVVLVAPEIAPNTGNIIRLCANTGSSLHLVEPLGFEMNDRLLKRGGLDYHELADVTVYPSLDSVRAELVGRWFAFSSSGTARYDAVDYQPDDILVFGAERAGLPFEVLASFTWDQLLLIPMVAGNRSLNLANAVSVVVYEAWRQAGFAGAELSTRSPSGAGRAGDGLTSETPGARPFDR